MNPRSAQVLTAALAFLLVVLVGATIFVLLSRPAVGPTPTPSHAGSPSLATPTAIAMVSPSASAALPTVVPSVIVTPALPTSAPPVTPTPPPTPTTEIPTPSPFPTPLETPTTEPTPTPEPTPSPTPPPTPTLPPTVNPTAAERVVEISGMGVDAGKVVGSVPRIVTFAIDGQSQVSAQVSANSPVQLCLWREAEDDLRQCDHGRRVVLQELVIDTSAPEWHASVIGTKDVTATVTLTIHFNSDSPSVKLDNFRYAGNSTPDYNGFELTLGTASKGELRVQAAFDDDNGGGYDWHLTVKAQGADPIFDVSAGPDVTIAHVLDVDRSTTYTVDLHDPDEVANPSLPVFLQATIAWP